MCGPTPPQPHGDQMTTLLCVAPITIYSAVFRRRTVAQRCGALATRTPGGGLRRHNKRRLSAVSCGTMADGGRPRAEQAGGMPTVHDHTLSEFFCHRNLIEATCSCDDDAASPAGHRTRRRSTECPTVSTRLPPPVAVAAAGRNNVNCCY